MLCSSIILRNFVLLGLTVSALALPATSISIINVKSSHVAPVAVAGLENKAQKLWPKHWEVATILYHYICPVGGDDNRVIKIQVHYEGDGSYFTGLQNAEKIGPSHHVPINVDSYGVTGEFNHGSCVHRPDGRKCGYSISGSLSATTDEKNRRYHFDIPQSANDITIAPTVIERCSLAGASDCPSIPGTACEMLTAIIAP